MTILQAHQLFKERFNRLASNYHQDLTPYQIDEYLYNGLTEMLKDIVEESSTIQKQNVLSSLLVTPNEQPLVTPVANVNNVYEFDLNRLKYPYFHFEKGDVTTTCGLIPVIPVTYNRLQDLLKDHHQRPSKMWRRTLSVIAKSSSSLGASLYVYSAADLPIESLSISYIRMPVRPFFGGYDTPDFLRCQELGGSDCNQYYSAGSPAVDIDLHPNFQSNVIDFAVKEAFRALGLVNEYQLTEVKTGTIIN